MTKIRFLCSTATIILSIGSSCLAQNTTYVWSSFDGDPYGLSGTIVLNSPSYSGNFDPSRIVSVTLSDNLSSTYNVNLPHDLYGRSATMEWGPSGISEIALALSTGAGAPDWFLVADENRIWADSSPASIQDYYNGPNFTIDTSGAWVPFVIPEPTTMCLSMFVVISGIISRILHVQLVRVAGTKTDTKGVKAGLSRV